MARLLGLLLLLCVAWPAQARFVSADPVPPNANNGENFNRYAYANHNPYRYTDPDGRWAEDVFIGVPSIALGAKSLYDNARSGNIGAAIVDGIGIGADAAAILTPGVPGGVGLGIQAGRAASRLPDEALVVRAGTNMPPKGANSPQGIANGMGMHPDGVFGFSAESGAGATLCQLCATLPNKQVGVTTAGAIRNAGGDAILTHSSRSPTHVTVTGLSPETASQLMEIKPNPLFEKP